MMKQLLVLLLLSGLAPTVLAQSHPDQASSEVLQSCLLGTKTEVWATLELTPDQTRRALRIQEACKEECNVAGAKKSMVTVSDADGSTILEELRNVLTKEQYKAWVDHCTAKP